MIKVFNTDSEYNIYSNNNTNLDSGILCYIKENDTAHFSTNNIDGEYKIYDLGSGGGGSSNDFRFYVEGTAETITIPVGTTKIGEHQFSYMPNLEEVIIPNTVLSIGANSFYICSGLTSIEIPNSVTTIGQYAFYMCPLTSITIPNSVTSIGTNINANNSSLTSVTIGSGVTSMTAHTFPYCSNLSTVTVYAQTPPTITEMWGETTIFDDASSNLVIYVPAASVNAYKAASGWSNYASKIQAIP